MKTILFFLCSFLFNVISFAQGPFNIKYLFNKNDKPDKLLLQYLENNSLTDDKFNTNGIYIIKSDSNRNDPAYSQAIVFYKNGLVYFNGWDSWSSYHNSDQSVSNFNYHLEHNTLNYLNYKSWGAFSIQDSNMSISVYLPFLGAGYTMNWYHLCHFEGIVSGDSIKEFKMTPPYPKLNKLERNFNESTLDSLKQPHTLVYIYAPKKALIDSSKVWINKYRKES
jgi:hypothetical protein